LDARHFDRLTRLLSARLDRRSTLGALVAGGTLGGFSGRANAGPEPARCVAIGDSCNKKKDRCCQQGECKGKVCKKSRGGGGGGGGTVSEATFERFFTGGPGLNRPKGIAFSTDGTWFVSENLENRIQVFDSNGVFQTRYSSSGSRQFNAPRGVAVYRRQFLYVVNTDSGNVLKLDAGNGSFITSWSNGGSGGALSGPTGVAVDVNGNVYVADSNRDRIVKFDANGGFLQQFGPGTSNLGRGSLAGPEGVAVASNGKVFVADTANNRIVLFKSSGEAQKEIKKFDNPQQRFNSPRGLALDADDNLYVADSDNDRIVVFARNGDFLFRFGGCCSGQGQFNTPYDCATDKSGNLSVADMANSRIQEFAIS
jgi:DNA-binding beta-propeller fold protein YncE